jgi:hypothetical protein
MRALALLSLFLLVACGETDDAGIVDGVDTSTASVTLPEEPDTPEAATLIVGSWERSDGQIVTITDESQIVSPLLGAEALAFRLGVDSMYVSDTNVYSAESVADDRRYAIETLTPDQLVLGPAALPLAGTYSRHSN